MARSSIEGLRTLVPCRRMRRRRVARPQPGDEVAGPWTARTNRFNRRNRFSGSWPASAVDRKVVRDESDGGRADRSCTSQRKMPASEDVERLVAVAVVIAVEKPALLLAVMGSCIYGLKDKITANLACLRVITPMPFCDTNQWAYTLPSCSLRGAPVHFINSIGEPLRHAFSIANNRPR